MNGRWGAGNGRRRANASEILLSEFEEDVGAVEGWQGVGTSGRKRGNGGRRRGKVPRVVRTIQGLGNDLRTGGGVVDIDLADVGPISNGKDKGGGRGRGAELGDDGEGRGH